MDITNSAMAVRGGAHTLESYEQLAGPVKNAVDKLQLVQDFYKVRGITKPQLESFNHFVLTEITKIIEAKNFVSSSPGTWMRYTNVRIEKPSLRLYDNNKELTPQECRIADMTYSAPIYVDIEYMNESSGKEIQRKERQCIGRMPIMLRSCFCVLYGKDEEELAKYGECPLDPGGYFIIKGTEKVILMQEELSKNIIIIDTDRKGCVQASVTTGKYETTIKMEKKKIYVHLPVPKINVPIMIVLKAMGMESDQEVVQMIGRDPQYSELLLPSIEDCVKECVHTQYQALKFIKQKVNDSSLSTQQKKGSLPLSVLRENFLSGIPVHENNFRPRCIYAAVMLRRMMDGILNKDSMCDKDYMGNKRLALSGQLLALLFEDLYQKMNIDVCRVRRGKFPSRTFDISQNISASIITSGLERALSTGNWDLSGFNMHLKGVTQVVSRLSYIGMLGHMTRISPQFAESREVRPRALHPSQWGMLCPCDTPVGEACGLVKNLALMAHVTTDEDEGPLISLCCTLGVEDMELLSAEELHHPNLYLIMLNGLVLGKHRWPQRFSDSMRKLRRAGKIGEFVSIFMNEKQRCVYIASDGGRVCRPLVIADKGVSRIKEHHMKELRDGVRTFQSFLKEGLIEYLDANEENNALIALYEENAKEGTTHIEIEPFTILGVCAGLIPYPHHNLTTKNTYQCAMGKQAVGNIAYNQLCRMDTLINLLVYPQRPLLTTRTIELVHYDKLGAGQNATVAVMSYSGYDIADAIVMNKSSLDRGFGRCIVMKKMSAVIEGYNHETNTKNHIVRPQRDGPDAEKMQILDDDGLAAPGEIIRPFDIYINKQSPKHRSSRQYKGPEGETPVVDRVALFSNPDTSSTGIKLMIRHTRRPEVGDKFSSRHGQKGVCGTIVQQEDFPFSEHGVCPDLLMNPHAFPSGMTVGNMIELLGGKAGVCCGRFHYGSAFGEPSGHADKVDAISETLVKHGFSYNGKDFIYSGITGEPLQAYIFMGPIYYQKSKHMVLDKMHARGCGPREMMTRQPTAGRSRNGGQHMGERECDSLIAYGASNLIYERLMLYSDPYEAHVCRKCGLLGYYHEELKMKLCSMCKNGENMSTMKFPYAFKLLIQELQSMNIILRLKLTEA